MATRAASVQAHPDRTKDAQALFKAGRWDGAVYLGGYVVEASSKPRFYETLA